MPPRALVRGCAFRAAIHARWCPERESNPHALFREAADFKSAASANFAIRAAARLSDRRRDHPPAWAYAQIWHSWLEGSRSHGVALAGTGKPQPASTESTITTQANLSIRPPVGSRYQARAIADPANGVRAGGAPHCSRLQWIRSVEDRQRGMHSWKGGGASRSRTGLNGFAIGQRTPCTGCASQCIQRIACWECLESVEESPTRICGVAQKPNLMHITPGGHMKTLRFAIDSILLIPVMIFVTVVWGVVTAWRICQVGFIFTRELWRSDLNDLPPELDRVRTEDVD